MTEPDMADYAALIADNDELLEIGRKAIEGKLVEWRDAGMFMLRNNGFSIRCADGSDSTIIRFGPELGIRIALIAIADHLRDHPSARAGEAAAAAAAGETPGLESPATTNDGGVL